MNQTSQRIHFIAIGGSIMHNLAIALHKKGHSVTGSDDEIFEPSRSLLAKNDLLPDTEGWETNKITQDIDAVILGMHARVDNPELLKAQELGLKIYSFPEYIYEQSVHKKRVVIAGSHGKTTITSIIMHVLKFHNYDFDYSVGARIAGFDEMVQLTEAPIIIIEGDEYLSSPIDSTPKFLKYHHHIGLVSGVSWDHINVFPTETEYIKQFDLFADATPSGGILIYSSEDTTGSSICTRTRENVTAIPYKAHKHKIEDGITYLIHDEKLIPIKLFGNHNLQNLNGAKEVLNQIGINDDQFYEAIQSFEGADKRLQIIEERNDLTIYKDFAHAPSKVRATTLAVKHQYPDRELVGCLELHTFSSLNKDFIEEYAHTMAGCDIAIVYYNPTTVAHKRLKSITKEDIKNSFQQTDLLVFDDRHEMMGYLKTLQWTNKNLLLMSSGTFDGLDYEQLTHLLNI